MITREYDIKELEDYYFISVKKLKSKIHLFKQIREKSDKELEFCIFKQQA